MPEEVRKLMRHKLDSSFVVFRDKVQEELKLSKEQVRTLEAVLPDAMQFLQRIEGLKPEEQEREIRAYRPMAHDRLAAVVRETLSEDQRTRLRQIELQRDQLFGGEIWRELHVTDEQQKQFMVLIQKTQNQIKTLMEEIGEGSQPRGDSDQSVDEPRRSRRPTGEFANGFPEKAMEGDAGQADGPA